MTLDFIHLHCHTEFSALDGLPQVEEYIIKCNEYDMPGIAITEHGNMRSLHSLKKKSEGNFSYRGESYNFNPIKPIYGIEFYVSAHDYTTRGMPDSEKQLIRRQYKTKTEANKAIKELEHDKGYRKRWHLLAFAKNNIGLTNLFKLHYLSWKDGFYYRPRIDFNLLKKYSEGLAVTTACIGGYIPDTIMNKNWEDTEKWLKSMKKVFGDDLYVEIQPHNIDEQKLVNKEILRIADDYKIKSVATNDCHYLNKEDWENHNVLLSIQSKASLKSNDAWRFGDTEFYMKTRDEMIETFKRNHPDISLRSVDESLSNTMEIFEKCNADIKLDKKKGILPKVKVPKEYNEKTYLVDLCKKGWKWREISVLAQSYAKENNVSHSEALEIYKDRLQFELKRIFKLRFDKYFLIIYDVINWARENDIMVGPGRGSSAASLVCYLLGITSIDPVKYDLLFDRFLGENRIDYPDVDMDFEDKRRKEIFKYIYEKYGEENVSQIGTIGRLKGKAVLKDVSRVLDIPFWEANQITKHILERTSSDARANQTVEDSFNEFDVCKKYNKKYPDVLKFAKRLEGRVKSLGLHAAGIQIADKPIDEITPIEYRKNSEGERIKATSFDWQECQEQGLIKLDILGLKTLTVLKDALKKIKERHGVEINLERISLDDEKVLSNFTNTRFVGIFQFDSIGMTKMCNKLNFNKFNDIIVLNALYRPGATRSGLSSHYIDRATGKERIKMIHPIYDEITKETNGILVYQEQFIKCFVDLAGYSASEGDELRKTISKSEGVETLSKEKKHFVDGSIKSGMDKKEAEKLFDTMVHFGDYSFNKAHSTAYSVISYWGMYLKTYYPTEFFYALMKNEKDHDEIKRFVTESRKLNVEVEMPDVNQSEHSFNILDNKKIISGLIDIKGCGDKAVDQIINNQPYTSVADFCDKVNRRQVHKGVMLSLAKAGAFRSLYSNQKALLTEIDLKKNGDKKTVLEYMLDLNEEKGNRLYEKVSSKVNDYSEDEFATVISEVCPIPSKNHKISFYSFIDKLTWLNVESISNIDYESSRICIKGVINGVKYNNVGDYNNEELSAVEKKRIGWGKRYANINIEDETGTVRCNVDTDIFSTFRHIVDKGIGTPVIIYARMFHKSETLFVDLMADLDEMKSKFNKNKLKDSFKKMNSFERFFFKHPVDIIPKDKRIEKKITADKFNNTKTNGTFKFQSLLLRIKYHWTKRNKKMAFLDFGDKTGIINIVCWSEQLEQFGDKLIPGNVLTYYINRKGNDKFLADRKVVVDAEIWKFIGE